MEDNKIKDNYRYGVGLVVVNKDKKVFAGTKNNVNSKMISYFLKRPWQMPQGGMEAGETPLETALRELEEETGIKDVNVVAETDRWLEYIVPVSLRRKDAKFVGQKQKWFLLEFDDDDRKINIRGSEHSEFDSWRWMNVNNIIRLSVHFKKRLYVEVFKEFQWYFDQQSERTVES